MFLDDTILNIIDVSDETMLNRSKELSKRLKQRKLYANIFTSGVSCNVIFANITNITNNYISNFFTVGNIKQYPR